MKRYAGPPYTFARSKNNPILVGEPGVGKTAIAEGLAHRIVNGDVPENLKSKIIYALDMGNSLQEPSIKVNLKSD